MNFKAELVGCFGFPVAENPTGVMQEAAFRALNLNWRYLTVEVPPEQLRDAVLGVRAFGMQGINLTIPHKIAVMEHLDRISPDAAIIGAVNTVRREGDRLIGENTDGKGFLKALEADAGVSSTGRCAVVLGAGGAARAIVAELALAGASRIHVVNRSLTRAERLIGDLAGKVKTPLSCEEWRGLYKPGRSVDLLINATSIGLYPDVDAFVPVDLDDLNPATLVCDVIPNPPETNLLSEARRRGLRVLDGLSMLVYQGVIGFQLWTGHTPSVPVMKRALREAFGLD